MLFVHVSKDISIANLTRDPAAIMNVPIYTGFLSQIGIFLWAAAAAICLQGALLVPQDSDMPESGRFLLAAGAVTLVLGLDDAFLLHEVLFPRLGIPEKVVYGVYLGSLLFLIGRFQETIEKTEFVLLGVALGFFGLSVVLDLASPSGVVPYEFLVEDGAKLVGIASWLAYFLSVGLLHARRSAVLGETSESADPRNSAGER